MGNTFGTLFRITTWGESHGKGIGVVIDGCPPRIPISEEEIQLELSRRRPGQSVWVSQRDEPDDVMFLSGVFKGQTLGTPISMMVWNKDAKPKDYEELQNVYRPSHADFSYEKKYGIQTPYMQEGSSRLLKDLLLAYQIPGFPALLEYF